jgi:hypothetical protein
MEAAEFEILNLHSDLFGDSSGTGFPSVRDQYSQPSKGKSLGFMKLSEMF